MIPTDAAISAAVNRAINPTSLTFAHHPGYTWCSFVKAQSSAKLEFHDGWVAWTDIQSKTTGWLAGAHAFVRAEFPALGIRYLVCSADTSQMETALKANGGWVNIDGRLRWDL